MEIKIYENASSEGIRRALSGFGRFSSIEVEENTDTNGKVFIFREIGFFKSLRRLIFESKENLEIKRENSRDHLYSFSKKNPEIQKLLGSLTLEKDVLTVSEFREKLKIKTKFIKLEKNCNLLEIPLNSGSKIGVIDAQPSEIKADYVVQWKVGPTKHQVDTHKIDGKSNITTTITKNLDNRKFDTAVKDARKINSFVHEYNPDDKELRLVYKAALKEASGHVVIEPIYDISVFEIKERQPEYEKDKLYKIYSDQSIRILIEEINSALIENTNIKNVTVARNDTPDDRFISRVLGQRSIIDGEKNRANEPQRDFIATMPDFLKLIDKEMQEQESPKFSLSDQYAFEETELTGISICEENPENIIADTAFLSLDSLSRSSSALAEKGKKQLQRVVDLTFKPGGVAKAEADVIFRGMADKWGIDALELPACELPVKKLFVMRNSMGKDGVERKSTKDLSKEFFIAHLEDLSGRVVIDPFLFGRINDGLFEALRELSERPEGLGFECVIASGNPTLLSEFKTKLSEKETRKSPIN